MKITINKESAVPIRDQLVEQLGLSIASGSLRPHEKLPSIRALADRLGVHYSTITAAYNHLAEVGLLEVRQGSGVRVAASGRRVENESTALSLEEMFFDFLARASENGYSSSEVSKCMDKLRHRPAVKRILVVDGNQDFHPLIKGELSPHFQLPVECLLPQQLLSDLKQAEEALVVSSLYHLFSFQKHIKDLTRLVACNIEPARNELEAVYRLPKASLLALVSVSPHLMQMAGKLVAAMRGEEIAVRAVVRDDETEIKYLVKHADLFLCDSISREVVSRYAPPAKMLVFNLYSSTTIDLIKERLAKWG
ncbi:MAG TPA: GntR family transcriptional regulator [Candidatus Obscuribacter sp.]|nr:GntR family transcriptional regulator [Candidatus Obscuribacter sp.]HMX45403.1 GntR family transcriptional regulator [Candidatus Obscuribacter sp.]HMY54793.1 GntR family transcriptional regulator [Candidatus Obscuribacter sp.]HNA74169.1 GntR family transcriptional regulator [Candidatus Obscuribacter sp.]HNB16635.1 GntR family transcriptional regulator [Candidatus Obscuribacter sp.]